MSIVNNCIFAISDKMESRQLEHGTDVEPLLLKCHKLEKEIAASAGLSVDEFHCISQLYLHEPCCVKTLRELLGLEPTRISRLLRNLEARGYLTRSLETADKRKERLALTEDGTAVARRLLQSSDLSLRDIAGSLSVVDTVRLTNTSPRIEEPQSD